MPQTSDEFARINSQRNNATALNYPMKTYDRQPIKLPIAFSRVVNPITNNTAKIDLN